MCAGMPQAETPAPSSHATSIADAVMGLPDILRARSAPLVGSLELGAHLGRGSYGKVYKGEPGHWFTRAIISPKLAIFTLGASQISVLTLPAFWQQACKTAVQATYKVLV